MILLRLVGFFFLVLSFYSIGAVAGHRSKSRAIELTRVPGLLDVGIMILSWLVSLAAYWAGFRTTLAAAIGGGMGFLAAFILHRLRDQSQRDEFRVTSFATITSYSGDRFPPNWKVFARQAGRFQSGLLLSVFYFIAITPFGIAAGKFGDPLGLKAPPGESFWKPREEASQSLEEARRQS